MKINVILKKEDIDPLKITDEHTVVVLDILLATSTIVSMLQDGAQEIYPVVDKMEALSLLDDLVEKSPLLIGEEEGELIEGFLAPNPLSLRTAVIGQSAILLTTNGTVAIRQVSGSRRVLMASLLNGAAVAKEVERQYRPGETIQIVCSGSSNQFCMEDFYGAGFFIDELLQRSDDIDVHLTDSAKSALMFYESHSTKEAGEQILKRSSVGEMLVETGFSEDIAFINKRNDYAIVPRLKGKRIVI